MGGSFSRSLSTPECSPSIPTARKQSEFPGKDAQSSAALVSELLTWFFMVLSARVFKSGRFTSLGEINLRRTGGVPVTHDAQTSLTAARKSPAASRQRRGGCFL